MALTPDDMSRLTLADVEAIAARFSAAVQTIRESQALLGGAPAVETTRPAIIRAQPISAQVASPEAQKDLDAWRNSPARAKLMEQFKPDAQPELES